MRSSTRSLLSTLALSLLSTSTLLAGPLSPPIGPVTSTPGPEPRIAINATNTPGTASAMFRITQPGSYYLTGSFTGAANMHGIQIASSGVTLDLNGFELRGVPNSLDGINVSANRGRSIIIRNGSIRSWGDCGIECEFNAGNPPEINVANIAAAANSRHGIATEGTSQIDHCRSEENGSTGIVALASSVITNCAAYSNSLHGFEVNANSVVTNCLASNNSSRGFYGAIGSSFLNCTAGGNGIGFVTQGSRLESCMAYNNSSIGFDLFTGCSVINSAAYRNGTAGIDASSNALIANCTVNENAGVGINAFSGTQIRSCSVNTNTGTGIIASSNCTVLDNSLYNNGGATPTFANIQASGSDNRIENNHCLDAPIGILVDSAGNFIARNTCSGNTVNWNIAAGNACLVILTTTTPAAFSGDSGGTSPGSTNPNANYTY